MKKTIEIEIDNFIDTNTLIRVVGRLSRRDKSYNYVKYDHERQRFDDKTSHQSDIVFYVKNMKELLKEPLYQFESVEISNAQ